MQECTKSSVIVGRNGNRADDSATGLSSSCVLMTTWLSGWRTVLVMFLCHSTITPTNHGDVELPNRGHWQANEIPSNSFLVISVWSYYQTQAFFGHDSHHLGTGLWVWSHCFPVGKIDGYDHGFLYFSTSLFSSCLWIINVYFVRSSDQRILYISSDYLHAESDITNGLYFVRLALNFHHIHEHNIHFHVLSRIVHGCLYNQPYLPVRASVYLPGPVSRPADPA